MAVAGQQPQPIQRHPPQPVIGVGFGFAQRPDSAGTGTLSVQISAVGAISSGSSSVPARTRIGIPAGVTVRLYICAPHFGQNPRSTVLPLSAVLSSLVISPVHATASSGNSTFTVAEPLAMYWQSRHQHMRAPSGSASIA